MDTGSIHSIEDPAIAGTIAAIGERWPRIAAAADCPLTEHFIRRIPKSAMTFRFLRINIFPSSIWLGLPAFVWPLFTYRFTTYRDAFSVFVIIYVIVIAATYAWNYRGRRRRVSNLREPADLLRDHDPGRLEQLCLANIQFKNLLGAGAALYYHHWGRCAAARAAMLAIAWLVLALIIGLTGHRNVVMIIDACLAVFLIGVGWVVCRPAAIVEAGMRDLFSGLLNRKTGLGVRPGGVLPFFLWPIMACTPIFAAIVYPVLGVPGWIGLTILAWIAEFARLAQVMDHELQMYFDHGLDNGNRMFQEMLSQETSDPLEELEVYGRMMLAEHRRKMGK